MKVTSNAKFCSVASKLPMSLVLQLCMKTKKSISGQHGSAIEEFMVPVGESYVVKGNSYPVGQPPKGFPKRTTMIDEENGQEGGGYAVTKNIPLEFMTAWLDQNKDTDMVKNGVIRMQVEMDSLIDDTADFKKLESGLGPLNPEHDEKTGKPLDRRSPRPINSNVSFVHEEPRSLNS